jgi:hypothetical protein
MLTLEDLGNIGEMVAAGGVICSLVYLALQIRRNTQQVARAEYDGLFDRFGDIRRSIYESPNLSQIMRVGTSEPEGLNESEMARFSSVMDAFFVLGMQIHQKTLDGALPRRAWEGCIPMYSNWINSPGGRLWWTSWTGSVYSDEFKAEISALREDHPP